MSTFDYVVGPECHVSICGSSADQIAELKALLPSSKSGVASDDDELPAWFGDKFVPAVCSTLHGFILSRKIAKHPIQVEPEWAPWVHDEVRGVIIGMSISVLHDGDDFEKLEGFFYSESFESFFKREIADQACTLLKPKVAWISADQVAVTIEGIGQG